MVCSVVDVRVVSRVAVCEAPGSVGEGDPRRISVPLREIQAKRLPLIRDVLQSRGHLRFPQDVPRVKIAR